MESDSDSACSRLCLAATSREEGQARGSGGCQADARWLRHGKTTGARPEIIRRQCELENTFDAADVPEDIGDYWTGANRGRSRRRRGCCPDERREHSAAIVLRLKAQRTAELTGQAGAISIRVGNRHRRAGRGVVRVQDGGKADQARRDCEVRRRTSGDHSKEDKRHGIGIVIDRDVVNRGDDGRVVRRINGDVRPLFGGAVRSRLTPRA